MKIIPLTAEHKNQIVALKKTITDAQAAAANANAPLVAARKAHDEYLQSLQPDAVKAGPMHRRNVQLSDDGSYLIVG